MHAHQPPTTSTRASTHKHTAGPPPPPPTHRRRRQVVNGCNIFARASPTNKLRIVQALQTGPGYEGPMDGDDPDDDGPPRASQLSGARCSTVTCVHAMAWRTVTGGAVAAPGGGAWWW